MSRKKIRVLVAEDDEVNAKAARMMLEQLGCHVDIATDGTEAPGTTTVFGGGGRGKQPAYAAGPASVAMSGSAVAASGGSQPHNNLPPYLVMNFCIALQGIYPSRE